MLSVGSGRNSDNEYLDDRTHDGEQKLAAMVLWHNQLTTVGWQQGLHWRLETSDVHMRGVAMTHPRAKSSLADSSIWRPVYTSRCAAWLTYMTTWPPPSGTKSNWPVNFAVKSITVKDVNGRETRQRIHVINTPRVSLNNYRYIAKQVIVGNRQ